MHLASVVQRVRDHYVEQFEVFVDAMQRSCVRGAAEIKLQIPGGSELYRGVMIVDFAKTDDDRLDASIFAPERVLQVPRLVAPLGDMDVVVEALRWDNVNLRFDPGVTVQLDDWFDHWFDPDELRFDANAKLGLVIHSLSVEPGALSVDLGTAPADALLQLLDVLQRAGVRRVVIDAS